MKPIDETAKSVMQNIGKISVTSLKKKPEQRQLDLAKALFQKMRAIFPQKWDSQFPNKEIAALNTAEWALAIADLTNEQLAEGVRRTRLECVWPPSIAEFRKLCGIDELMEHKSPAYVESRKALPAPLCKKEIWEAQRAKLRKLGLKV